MIHIAYYIAFGNHGPRAAPPPDENWRVAGYTALGCAIGTAIFVIIRAFGSPEPSTMTKEWQEASNEYLRVRSLYFLYTLLPLAQFPRLNWLFVENELHMFPGGEGNVRDINHERD